MSEHTPARGIRRFLAWPSMHDGFIENAAILTSILIIAVCALLYELLIGTISSYLRGDSIFQFSITIGLFLSAMGLGSYLSKRVQGDLIRAFMIVEILIGVLGGFSAALLYAVYALFPRSYDVVMAAVILFLGSCIGLEIPLLTRVARRYGSLRDTLANILSFDYIGALAASLLFPLVLLPYFGPARTGFLVGLLNLLVVVINLRVFRRQVDIRGIAVATIASMAILAIGFINALNITGLLEQQFYNEPVILAEQTPYQRIVLTRKGEDLRLYLDSNLQFSTRDEYRYHESLVYPALSMTVSREHILILGGGDGLVAREALKFPGVRRITLVDLDRQMTDLAKTNPLLTDVNQGSLSDPRVQIVTADAFKYLEASSDLYPVIIADLPDPRNENLAKLYSREFYTLVSRHLAPGGIFVTQSASPYFVRYSFWSIVHSIRSTDLQTLPYHAYVPSFGDWGFVMASNLRLDPAKFQLMVPGRFVTPDFFKLALQFDGDTGEVDAAVSTLEQPEVLQYYIDGWKRWREP